MVFRQFSIFAVLSFALLQPNGCSPKEIAQSNNIQQKQTATPKPSPVRDNQKGDQNKMDLLEQKVLNKEPSAVNLAKQMGKSAFPILKPLAKHPDEVVRMIALSCLRYTSGERIEDIFINALKDESATTSVEAVIGLQPYLSPAIYSKLLAVYDDAEPVRRKDIALMLGKIDGAKIADLKKKAEDEKDAEAKEGLMVAMAKLGDGQAREEFLSRLHSAKDQELKRFIDYVEYIGQNWAIKGLNPILDNKNPLVRIGVDNLPQLGPEYLRACDVAVNLINKLLHPKFSFTVAERKNYSDAELQQVKKFLTTLR